MEHDCWDVDDDDSPAYVFSLSELVYILSSADSVFILLKLAQEQLHGSQQESLMKLEWN